MWWDTLKDYMIALLGCLLLLIPLIHELMQKKSKAEKKKRRPYMLFLIFSTAALLLLGIDKINRDNKEKKVAKTDKIQNDKKIDTLTETVQSLTKIKSDYDEFMQNLKTKYSIERDANNQPIVFNTNIDKAGTVNIGRK